MSPAALVIGIDGGGTSLRAALAPAAGGEPLATAAAGAGNARSVPGPELADRFARLIADVCPAPVRPRVRAVAAGLAGVAPHPADPGRVRAAEALAAALRRCGLGAVRTAVHGDVEAAFASAPDGPADGLVVIAGTGAGAARIRGRREAHAVDGLGWLAGDDGSGFWIARRGVRAALRALDDRGPATALTRSLAAAAGVPAGAGQQRIRIALVDATLAFDPSSALAAWCPYVVRTAEEGDAVAAAILDEAVDRLVGTLAALRPEPGEPLVTVGGLLGPEGPLREPFALRAKELGLRAMPVPDGVAGALRLAAVALQR